MKNYCLLGMLFMISSISYAQNLVPNPSFEDTVQYCPSGSNIDGKIANWYSPTNYSPDYFHSCDTDSIITMGYNASVPYNAYGFQTAKSGVAYIGMLTMMPTDLREYIQVELNDTLRNGQEYCVSFFVCFTDSGMYAVNDIGAYLSQSAISSLDNLVLPFTPQIENDPVMNPLDVRDQWIEVSGTYVASGGEKYLTIGNFKDDMSTDTTYYGTGWEQGYNFIDDVSLELCDTTNSVEWSDVQVSITISPNPSSGLFEIRAQGLQKSTIIVYDLSGRQVSVKILKRSLDSASMDMSGLLEGAYFVSIAYPKFTRTKKIVIIKQ